MDDTIFMRRAIALSAEAATAGGGPFGAVVVRDARVIGEGTNQVVPSGDPTAHAEVVAIRRACAAIGSHDLAGATIYTSCEPCPMCLGAIWWSRIGRVVYGNTRADAAAIGFDDDAIYREVASPLYARSLPMVRALESEALAPFTRWAADPNKVMY